MKPRTILLTIILLTATLIVAVTSSAANYLSTTNDKTNTVTTNGIITRVSVASDGMQGDSLSFSTAISADGRYVAFNSVASNLVPYDTNHSWDIFVHDTQTGQTSRVSVASDGTQGNRYSYHPTISADGRYIAFSSLATNLVPNDTNNQMDIFVHDTQTGQTRRVSVASDGAQGNDRSGSRHTTISANGRYVAFHSRATNLIPNDTNGTYDVFVHDTQTSQTTRISVASDGTQGNDTSEHPSISADGRYVAFNSSASNLVSYDTNGDTDVFVHDTQTNQTTRISIAPNGDQGYAWSISPSISADGRYVAFKSLASNLVPNDTNARIDVFIHDSQTDQISRVSISSDGVQGNAHAYDLAISPDGHFVAFQSDASNLVSNDTNDQKDIFVHDTQTGLTSRVSVTSDGTQGNDPSFDPSISTNGRYVTFSSVTDMVPSDTNGFQDVFVHDREGNIEAYSITGQTINEDDSPLPGVTIASDTGLTTISDDSGNYGFTGLITGTYVITPTKSGYIFSPVSQSVSVPPTAQNINFVATTDSVLPIIFIPGIGGSTLHKPEIGSDRNVWPIPNIPIDMDFHTLSLTDDKYDLYVGDAIREMIFGVHEKLIFYKPLFSFLEEEGYVEYVVDNNPERRTSSGCDLTQAGNNPSLFIFAYDWRKSIETSAVPQLEDYLGCIQQFYPAGTQVNIIAHSMGGLVARRFVMNNPNTVDKFISIGSPYLGTPKAPFVYETGDIFPQVRDYILKDLIPYFKGASTLLPSPQYFNFDSDFIAEDGWDINDNGTNNDAFSTYYSFTDLMNSRYPNDVGMWGHDFHTPPQQDDWSNDNLGIDYFHIVGRQDTAKTIGSIRAKNQWHCDWPKGCWFWNYFDTQLTVGDKTVALPSATRCDPDLEDSPNLNAPNAKVKIFTGDEGAEHTGLTKNSAVHAYIADILAEQASSDNYCDTNNNQQQAESLIEPAYYLKIFGSDTFTITDSLGNQLIQVDEIYEIKPDEYAHHVLGEQVHLFVLPTGRTYEVEFPVGSDGAAVELTRGDGTTVDMAVRYNDVALSDTRNTQFSFDATTHTFLYDDDDNGSYESPFTPTATVTGTAANDSKPPTVDIDVAKNGDSTSVTIAAEDDGSGVKGIYYSLDGVHFDLYDAPLTIGIGQAQVVSVFADDNNGNRSGSETAQIGFGVYLPMVIR